MRYRACTYCVSRVRNATVIAFVRNLSEELTTEAAAPVRAKSRTHSAKSRQLRFRTACGVGGCVSIASCNGEPTARRQRHAEVDWTEGGLQEREEECVSFACLEAFSAQPRSAERKERAGDEDERLRVQSASPGGAETAR